MLKELVLVNYLVSNMVLNDLSVTLPTTVFKHSRKGKPFDNLYIDNMHRYALHHILGNILPGKIDIKV